MDKADIRSLRAPVVAAGAAALLLATGGASPAPAADEPAATLAITDFAFSKATTKVSVGDTITWTNSGKVAHLAKAAKAPVQFASPKLKAGESWSFEVTKAGTYSYLCTLHPAMKAKIVAVASTGTEAVATTAAATTAAKKKAAAAKKAEADKVAEAELAAAAKELTTENSLPLFAGGVALAAVLGLIARARRPSE